MFLLGKCVGCRVNSACFTRASKEVEGEGSPKVKPGKKNMTLAIMTVWQCKNENEWQWKLRLMLTTTMKEWGQCWAMQNGNNAKIRNPLEHREHLHLHLLYLPLRICVV